MKHERIIEFVGGSEDEVAYLRLQLRKSAKLLTESWRLRREDDPHVDMLIIDDISDVGAHPGSRDESARRVRLVDPARGATGIESLVWPLAQDILVLRLNQSTIKVSAPAVPAVVVPAIQHNVYDDLFDAGPSDRWSATGELDAQFSTLDFDNDWLAATRAREAALTEQAEQFFREDPRLKHQDVLKSIRLHDDIDVEATEGHTQGGGNRKDRRGTVGDYADTTHTLTIDEAIASYPLADYLSGKLLPGPSRLEACHVVLTLDPRNRQYYAKGALCVFEDCCKQPLRRGDWHGLSTTAFAEVKKLTPARPYSELQWLCAYLDEHPSAAAELGADTRYTLRQTIDLQRDYPRAARVAKSLEAGSTLAAAATQARVTLAEAQRVAAAFDAVGFLIPD